MINRDYYLKQHKSAEYLKYSDLNGESIACRFFKKINTRLNLLLRQSNYYSATRLLYNALIQPHFDYGCTSWSIS